MNKTKNIIFFACLLLILSGCGKEKQTEKNIIPVRVIEVKLGDLKEELFYVGDILAQDQADVCPKVTGKLIENKVKEGDSVKKGQTIALIDRDEIGFEFKPAPVTSPISGIIGRMYLDRGSQVSPQIAVSKIINIENVKVKIEISEIDLPKLKEGQPVVLKVDAYPKMEFKGMVDRISPVLDLWSRTAPTEIIVPNHNGLLKPGMFARVWIVVNERLQIPYISKDAVIEKEGGIFAFTIKDKKAHLVRISLGLEQDLDVEVTEGLNPGDLVIVVGHKELEEGKLVKVVD